MIPRSKLVLIFLASLVGAGLGAGSYLLTRPPVSPPATDALAAVEIGGPFRLTDMTGREVTDATYRGKWLMVFFGFTFCPDVCPTALNNVAAALERLGPLVDQVQPLFISVDPGRDTPEALARYTSAFDDRIVGLTGTPEDIAAVAKAYRAYYRKVGEGHDYAVDHSAIIYVMTPVGRYEAHFNHETDPERMASKLQALIAAPKGAAS
jgi:protein SCO1/2